MDNPATLAAAGLPALRQLLTTHVRQDRLVEGHLAAMLASGHISAIIRRLGQLRDQAYD